MMALAAESPSRPAPDLGPALVSRTEIHILVQWIMASLPHFGPERAHSAASKPGVAEPAHEMMGYRALVSRAVEAFGDEIKASRWLSLPNRDLEGQTPLQAVQASGYDMHVLEPILTRIEHGIDY